MSAAYAFVTAFGLLATGSAITLVLGYAWFQQALRDNYLDGARMMLEEAKAQQRYAYKELAGEPNAAVMLDAVDAMVGGLQATYQAARDGEDA